MQTLSFGYPGDGGLGDRLLAAVLRGEKTATSSLAVEYLSGEPMPRRGERLRLTDHSGRHHGVVETTRVTVTPLDQVGDDVAHAEGEGFADAAQWRADHVAFWADVAAFVRDDAGDPAWELRASEPVVVHWFRLLDAAELEDAAAELVERCRRPLAGEALELLAEGIAGVEALDRIVRAAGFPVGPFEAADLEGLDVALRRAERASALGYGEPRWRPSPLAARMVGAGRLGRAVGRGWYEHAEGATLRAPDPPPPTPGGGARRLVVLAGDLTLAHELRALAEEADWRVEEAMGDDVPWLIVACGPAEEDGPPLQGAPQALLCAEGALHELDPGGGAVGFHALPPLEGGGLVELTRGTATTDLAAGRAEAFFTTLGLHVAWVGDAPGLVLGRIVAQLVNEAAFALTEGIAPDPQALDDVLEDAAFPRGPLAWGDEIGLDHVLAVLDALRATHGERYRAAPLLRRMVADGHLGMATAQGFHAYEEPDEWA